MAQKGLPAEVTLAPMKGQPDPEVGVRVAHGEGVRERMKSERAVAGGEEPRWCRLQQHPPCSETSGGLLPSSP